MNRYNHPDEAGYYGTFGGAWIPEMLHRNVEELRTHYQDIIASPDFQADFHRLLRDYVGRPTPLWFAERLSQHYGTRIFLKREDLNHTGAHKINNTIGQILLAQRLGKKRIIAETGAGQHGVATATVCALMDMECIVYMGATDMKRQAPNVARMKMLGAEVRAVHSGSCTLKDATNEAIRDWIAHPDDTHYIIGSVVGPHPYPDMVARFQSVISKELRTQLKAQTGRALPDAIIACVGGGSNAAGAFYHFLEAPSVRLIAAEAAGLGVDSGKSAATSVLGSEGIIHGSRTLLMQTADGQIVEPHSISAGLDYPGIGPLHAHLIRTGRAEVAPITDTQALQAGYLLTQLEGIIPALESAHALAVLEQCHFEPDEVVVVNLSGRGDKDLDTYVQHMETAKPHTTAANGQHKATPTRLICPSASQQPTPSRQSDRTTGLLNIYFTAGYPKLNDTVPLIEALTEAGVDLIEVGMPYSDPLADGPTIQHSSAVALRNGMTLDLLFEQIATARLHTEVPLILMGYYNQVMQYGEDRFLERCKEVGIDGLILPDLPLPEYEQSLQHKLTALGLGISLLITPHTSEARIRKIDELTRGFIYMVSTAATTGARKGISAEQEAYFQRIAAMQLRHPCLIGFGISDSASFEKACCYADGAIIGSAFINALTDASDVKAAAQRFVRTIRQNKGPGAAHLRASAFL